MANYFLDRTNKNGNLAGTWTFTNGSATVAGSGGNAQTLGLGAGDYIKPDGTDEWYKIASVGSQNSITLAQSFAQPTQTSVVANYADVSVNDGTTVAKAFVHLNQYTTDTTRAAGDVLYVRRNQTHLHVAAIDIVFDENGTLSSPIEIVGDDGTGWPGDSNVKPVFNFSTGARGFALNRNYWICRRIVANGNTTSYGSLNLGGSQCKFYDCVWQNCTGGAYAVVFVWNGQNEHFERCAWSGNSNYSIQQYQGSYIKLVDCTFDGNANCINNGSSGCVAELENCTFGQSVANSGYNIACGTNAKAILRNCTIETGATKIQCNGMNAEITSEDHNGVKGDNRRWVLEGTVVKDTAIVRSGGASSSAKVTPASNLTSSIYPFQIFEACIWTPASQKTVSLYMLGNGWSTLPSNTELYTAVEYFDAAGTAHKATAVSTAVLSGNDVWCEFPVTVTPAAEGLLRVKAYLKKYQANAYIYVDIKPVVT